MSITSFQAVRSKIEELITENNEEEADAGDNSPAKQQRLQQLLACADGEVRESIIPVLVEHVVRLIEQEAHTLETIDIDLMMMAYGGQFVETIVTNAVLQTNVHLHRNNIGIAKQPHKKKMAFVEVSNMDAENKSDMDGENDTQNNNKSAAIAQDIAQEWKLEWSGLLAGVLRDIHHKLERMSNSKLGRLEGREGNIHCVLCKPKTIDDIKVKILGMSASKFILHKLLLNALQCLPVVADDVQSKMGQSNDLAELGKALMKEANLDNNQHALLNTVVEDMEDTILTKASEKTADDLIEMLTLQMDMDTAVIEKVKEDITDKIKWMGDASRKESEDDDMSLTLKLKVRTH